MIFFSLGEKMPNLSVEEPWRYSSEYNVHENIFSASAAFLLCYLRKKDRDNKMEKSYS